MIDKFHSGSSHKISQKHVEKAGKYLNLIKKYDKQIEALKMIFSPDELHTIIEVTLKNKKSN